MRTKVLVLQLLLVFSAFSLIPSNLPTAEGDSLPDPTPWRPYGPHIKNLRFQVYGGDECRELDDFLNGGPNGIDVKIGRAHV